MKPFRQVANLVTITLVLLVAPLVAPRAAKAEQMKPLHHLLYDEIDHIFYCLGSAIDCDWVSVP